MKLEYSLPASELNLPGDDALRHDENKISSTSQGSVYTFISTYREFGHVKHAAPLLLLITFSQILLKRPFSFI